MTMPRATRVPHRPASGPKGRAHATRAAHHAALRALLGRAAGDWAEQAACGSDSDVPPELFWPRGEADPRALVARAVCAGCPVRGECLAYAETTRQPAEARFAGGGIWGGLTGEERLAERRRGWRPGMPAPVLRPLGLDEQAVALGSPWGAWLPGLDPELRGWARRWTRQRRRAG